jgi:hypothetical protein
MGVETFAGYGIAGEAVYFHPLEEVKEAVWQLKQ